MTIRTQSMRPLKFDTDEIELIDVGRLGDLVAFRVQLATGTKPSGKALP